MPGSLLEPRVGRLAGGVSGAIGRCGQRHGLGCSPMAKMAVSPFLMSVSSYYFCSNRSRLQMTGGHACGHRVAHPAAQQQQENHGNEQGTAHD